MEETNISFDIPSYWLSNNKKEKEKDQLNKCIKYFNGDDLAASVYIKKYSYNFDSPDDMHISIAHQLHQIEKNYPNPLPEEYIFDLLKGFKYLIPGGSVMYGLNNPKKLVSLGNCFVIGEFNEKDSYGSIIHRDEEQVHLMKRRGGVGQDLSFMRGKGSPVNNSANTSTGIVPFAERYSNSIKEVAQDGRRGAGMLTLEINHPDAMSFIKAKANTDKINGANISLKIHDEFMESLDSISKLSDGEEVAYLQDPYENQQLFNELIKNARDFSEPGILFWDRMEEEIDHVIYGPKFSPISTNPCGELPLSPYESCRLLSINLYSYVDNPFTDDAEFNYELFEKHVYAAQRLMDDIVDLEIVKINNIIKKLEKEKLICILGNSTEDDTYTQKNYNGNVDVEIELWKKVLDKTELGRRTGLGFTAIADMFAALNIKYDSQDAIIVGENVASLLLKNSYKSSIDMAKERGAFPYYNTSELDRNVFEVDIIETLRFLFVDDSETLSNWQKYGRRNIQNLAIAPTGSISIMTQTASGIEPVFMLRYKRRKRVEGDLEKGTKYITDDNGTWEEFNVVHPKLMDWYKVKYPDRNPQELRTVSEDVFQDIVKESPYYKATAHEIDPMMKVTLQSVVQKYIDGSISITHNLPENVKPEVVEELAMYAWETGCKGFTVYRDNSRGGILIGNDKKETFTKNDATQRPKELNCEVHTTSVKGERWVVLVGILNDSPYEMFAFKLTNKKVKFSDMVQYTLVKTKSKEYALREGDVDIISNILEYFENPEEEFITRLISTSLRHGTDVSFVYDQLVKSNGYVTDFSKSIARVLKKYINTDLIKKHSDACPECGNTIVYEGGCASCSCGWSKC